VSYREFWFNANSAQVIGAQKTMPAEMAEYMKRNPSLVLAIDGFIDPNNKDLSTQRINAIRDSLTDAGMPAERIKVGDFGDPRLKREGRVEVLVKTGP